MANRWGNNGNSDRLYFRGSKITADCDCSHEIKRCLLLGRKDRTNLDIIIKRTHLVKAMVFPVVMYECEKHQRTDAFELWYWRRLLRVPWTVRRSNQSIIKEISPEYSLGGLMLSWNSNTLATWREELTPWKRLWCWERLKAGGEGYDRRYDGWMASPMWWTWVWIDSESWWWTGKPGVLQSMGLQRVGHDWVTELQYFNATFHLSNFKKNTVPIHRTFSSLQVSVNQS